MKYYWKSATSGNFATAGNWSPSGPPGVFDQAILTATGAFYTVAATNDQTVLTVSHQRRRYVGYTGQHIYGGSRYRSWSQ